MNFTTLHPPLIADPDVQFLERLSGETGATLSPPVTVSTPSALNEHLTQSRFVFSGIFVNPALVDHDLFKLLTQLRTALPSTPLYLISAELGSRLNAEQLQKLTVSSILDPSISYPELLKQVTEAQITQSSTAPEVGSSVVTANQESEFVPVLSSHFLSGAAAHFNVYVKLGDMRFVQIVRQGDALSAERLALYHKKNTKYFYIRESDQALFLKQSQEILNELIRTPNVSITEKATAALEHGKQVRAFLQARTLSQNNLQYAEAFVDSVVELTTQLKLNEIADIRARLEDPAYMDHASAGTLISALVGSKLGLKGDKAVALIGLASFLHDIALPSLDPRFLDAEMDKMSALELVEYKKHPEVGAELLRQVAGVEPIAIQAIRQHHERRNRKGFPLQLGPGQINLISEVVGISDELLHQISRCSKLKGPRKLDPMKAMEMTSFNGFSTQVIEAFQSTFGNA